jgi:hypothetical protein
MKLLDILLETYKEEYFLNLEEGLIKSTSIGQTVSLLKKQIPNWDFTYEKGGKSITVEVLAVGDVYSLEDLNKLNTLLNSLGWFISYMFIQGVGLNIRDRYDEKVLRHAFQNKATEEISLVCEAKFDQKVNKIPDFLYHIAPLKNWEKIHSIGLVPKSRSKRSYHPERVYLGKDEKHTIDLASKFYQVTGTKEWVLLKIDISMVPGDYLRLYYDPNFKHGYYTLNNIPPQAVEKIQTINL